MIVTAQLTPLRFARIFTKPTRLEIQVTGAATISLGHEQGEVSNPTDGIKLNNVNTATPFGTWWQGELWYSSNVADGQFVIVLATPY